MVHKRSEYRLQFRHLDSDVRTQIWRENVSFRESQKLKNLSDHYWRYQLMNEECDCDDVYHGISEDKFRDVSTPVLPLTSPEKQQHQHERSTLADQAVQTPDWTCLINKFDGSVREESAVEATGHEPQFPVTVTSEMEIKDLTATPQLVHETATSTSHTTKTTPLPSSCIKHSEKKCPAFQKSNTTKLEPSHNVSISSHLNPSPTRDMIKSFRSEKKPIFAAFGWNDGDKDVGDKKTHNVFAPLSQINLTALLASEKRRKEIEEYFALQRKHKRQQQSLLSLGSINHHSIWMTEYQEKFCQGQREAIRFPRGLPSRSRPVVLRHS